MINIIKNKIFEEIVFFIALGLAVFTGIFAELNFNAIDYNVIGILATLMLITLAFEKYEVLDFVAVWVLNKADSERKTAGLMIVLTAVLAMFITNDVALITVVPISMTLSKRVGFNPFKLIVLEALAANIGSSLTPFGNPQNLYLYNQYAYDLPTFISIVAPFVLIGMILLTLPIARLSSKKFEKVDLKGKIQSPKWVGVYGILFIASIFFIVLRMNILILLTCVSICVIIRDRELFRQLDYFLLGTFVCFFIFVDHVNQFAWMKEMIRPLLSSEANVFLLSALFSQGISNVPSAILFSAFVEMPNALLLGVSVGGLGTMIASLANLIAYKYYAKQYETKAYQRYFLLLNVSLLVLFMVFYYWILIV
jgi:Na+/H+ antiporter NhaD/arsenite permease-like protein